MKTHKNIYYKIYKWDNLFLAFKKARKRKTKKLYVKKFEENLIENLQQIQFELMTMTYKPSPLKTFIIRDPKTRKISASTFKDRIVHHALCNIIEPMFQKTFIYDSCANQKKKGTLFGIKRFEKFKRKVTNNLTSNAYCLKADIKHYFQEVDRKILIKIIIKKIHDKNTIKLIQEITNNFYGIKGMPLGNLTSQLFANVYLNDLDHYVKNNLRIKYYIRYVDDFILLDKAKEKLKIIKIRIEIFLRKHLYLKLHPEKSKIISLSTGIDFIGFRLYYRHKLLRKRNIKNFKKVIQLFNDNKIIIKKFIEIYNGHISYAKLADTYNLRTNLPSQNPCLSV